MNRPLTVRQQQVLELIAEGLSCKEIGHRMGLSTHTVKNYRGGLLNYFGAIGMNQVVATAFRRGLLK